MAAPAVNNIQSTSSSLTLSYTVPTVTDGRLVVMVGIEDVGNNNPITSVTFGASALTQDADAVSVVGSNANRMAIYSLASPTAGTDTITISASNERIGIIAFTLSDCGAKTDSDTDVVGGSGSTMTTNVTTVGADNIVVSCTNSSTTSATTNPAGTTSIVNVVASATVRFQSFYENAASAGLVSTTSAFFPARSAMATVSYAPSRGGGGATIIPTGIATGEAFGTALVQNTLQVLSPTGIATEEAIGTAIVSTGGVLLSPVGIPTSEAFGSPSVEILLQTLQPTSISSLEAFGTAIVEKLLQIVEVAGIGTQETFGSALVLGGDSITIPVDSRQTWNRVAAYLRTLNFKGSDNDVICGWLRSEGIDDQYNDMWVLYFNQQGLLGGTLTDKQKRWERGE